MKRRGVGGSKNPPKKNRLVFHSIPVGPPGSSDRVIQTPSTQWNIRDGHSVQKKYIVMTTASIGSSPSTTHIEDEAPDLNFGFNLVDASTDDEEEETETAEPVCPMSRFLLTLKITPLAQKTQREQLLDWRNELPQFLDEILGLDGRGEAFGESTSCAGCHGDMQPPQYRCPECWLSSLVCESCIVESHKEHPLHRVEFWMDEGFFVKVPLRKLGLRLQLGHEDGSRCSAPTPSKGDLFTIIDVHAIHEVSLDFCGCGTGGRLASQLLRVRLYPATTRVPTIAATFAALDYFQILSFESKLNLHDYYGTILRQTDNMDLKATPAREDQLRLMVREWRHLHMVKRAGCSHDPAGVEVASSKAGALALRCPACPHPGINLPNDWKDVPPEKQFLYALFIGMDANFKLKRKGVSSETKDPSLSDGAAYFVPEQPYQEHLEKYKHIKQEASKCVSHDAVNSADTKDTRGLVVTGAGAVDCTRHDFKLPASMGDLQFGERYLNMDFCLFSTLAATLVALVYLSYDIMCQYNVNFGSRMQRFPKDWSVNTGKTSFKWLIPKFHLPAHIPKCHRQFSFNFLRGCGRTEGEAVERAWSKLNPLAWSTKEMGPGSRRDTLNDHIGHSNWKKIGQMGRSLLTKLFHAIPARAVHRERLDGLEYALLNHQRSGDAANDDLDPLSSMTTEMLGEWRKEVETWEEDPEAPNPFEPRVNAPTVQSVRLTMAQEDAKELDESLTEALLPTLGYRRRKKAQLQPEITARTMIAMGLELEELQRKLTGEFKALGLHSTDLQQRKLIEKSTTVRRRIMSWFQVQAMYIPGIALLHAKDAASATLEEGLPDFRARLWLPSEIGDLLAIDSKLHEYEWLLREAQANDALESVRTQLLNHAFLVKKKVDYASGVRENNRSDTTIQNTTGKMRVYANCYRVARKALWNLRADARRRSASREGRSVREITWIWTALGTNVSSADKSVRLDAMRIEWLKYRARAMRWEEEVDLILEEMRRVNVFLLWKASSWREKADNFISSSQRLQDGGKAYALHQAAMYTAMQTRNLYPVPAIRV
ncbi:hypothetical protein C8J56DRAFT_1054689 [Mycena floridula]|nr:hypothetical protein C8J56DRAFT_1054689 [Mycena floridula]